MVLSKEIYVKLFDKRVKGWAGNARAVPRAAEGTACLPGALLSVTT